MPTATPSRQLVATPSHEGSPFRPAKDSDDVRQQWKRNEVLRKIIDGQNDSINQITRTVEKLRRRILGGIGGDSGGGYMGEYDKTKAYSAGETFDVTAQQVIAGITVIQGFYGVPPAGIDSVGKTWAGNVPANPTGNAVPQYPLPTIGAAPNDKFYAKPIVVYCGGY